jgi:hypothetical protein
MNELPMLVSVKPSNLIKGENRFKASLLDAAGDIWCPGDISPSKFGDSPVEALEAMLEEIENEIAKLRVAKALVVKQIDLELS